MEPRADGRVRRLLVTLLATTIVASLAPAAAALELRPPKRNATGLDLRIEALAERQREELGIPKGFFPFLEDDARVRTGRWMYAETAPDLIGGPDPEIIETDLRYRYEIGENQDLVRTVEGNVNTKIKLRSGRTGEKLWAKRFDRDAYAFPMRVGRNGEHGIVVITGMWNFYGTTEEMTLRFDAFDKRGRRLWSREYRSTSYYDMVAYVTEDAPIVIATFNGVRGRADDLLIGLATMVNAYVANTIATRTVVIDGRDGSETAHPIVDVGIDWWPVPLPTGDLDGDRLDDYATTNRLGVDPGDEEAQEGPSIGGTVYARKGTNGSPVWTTSGLKMDVYAFTEELPDVAADPTPDVSLSTLVAKGAAPLPLDVPLVGFMSYSARVYLLDGGFGAHLWHRKSHWIYSPGDIDGGSKPDLMLGVYRMRFSSNKTMLEQVAVNGSGDTLWKRRSGWRFETMPCPRGACFGWAWGYLDWTPDYDPDRIRDSLFVQAVQQNAAFEDRNTRAFHGRTGRLRFEDGSDAVIQTTGVAIDGHGTDLAAFEYAGVQDKVRVSARNGWNRVLWSGLLGGRDELTPRNSGFYAIGFKLPGDRCGDLVINGWERDQYFYGVFDGGSGKMLWSRWTGPSQQRPRISDLTDRNGAC